jgi:hypothetical protein
LNYARDTTSGQEGLDLLQAIQKMDADLLVVVKPPWATIDLAVECMRNGGADFMQKPWKNTRVSATVASQAAFYRAKRKATLLAGENRTLKESKSRDFLARSDVRQPIIETMHKMTPSDANILITGKNGTGKGVAGRYIHSLSARPGEPFVSINMGGLASGVAESELFGHVKGAFTDAKSDRPRSAEKTQACLRRNQAELKIQQAEQAIRLELDNASIQLEADWDRIQAARLARELAEKSLEAEEKKLQAGTSTTFMVLRLQGDLAVAEIQETNALTDYRVVTGALPPSQGQHSRRV